MAKDVVGESAEAIAERMVREYTLSPETAAKLGKGAFRRANPNVDAVVVAYIHDKEVTYSWHHSMIEMLGHDMGNAQRVMRGGYIAMGAETDGLSDARNKTVKLFLEERQADWLFWIDTDMGFAPDTIDRLLEVTDPESRPIVGGLCFTQRQESSDGMGGWRCLATPTLFDWGHDDSGGMGFVVNFGYSHDAVQQVAGTGSACILIHRSALEKVEAKFGPHWYDRIPNPTMGRVVSEDLSFCMRANSLQIPVWVDTSVKTTHQKTMWLAEDDFYGQVALSKLTPSVPPATEATAVVVPVLGRPQNAAPFMLSVDLSDPAELAKVYAVVDDHDRDTAAAWQALGAEIVWFDDEDGPGTFAEKVNLGYLSTDEPWLFLVGDDVKFSPGWLDHAQHAARDGAHVVGTNDMHNPLVTAGEHATHLLVRRAYVDERGASWDGPKVVCHEGYRHNFVDDEVVTVAKQRGVWAFAKHSTVEHLHPFWGLAEDDETYALGRSHVEEDRALYEARRAEYGASL